MADAILVLGRSGQVARELAKLGPPPGFGLAFAGRERLDLLSGADPSPLLDEVRPAVVINAAAYTAVDRAESEPDLAYRLNRDAPAALAAACAGRGIGFVHFSTDYVFDGRKAEPYLEDDPRAPQGVYGASKAAGEEAVEAAGGRHAILRTAWVYSASGANFVKTMLRLAQMREEVAVVDDQRGNPTWAEDCARGALLAAERLVAGDAKAEGVFHLAGEGEATWADFAEAVFEESARRGGKQPRVRPISTLEYPTPARRPANSRLDCGKLVRHFGWRPRPWREALAACFDELETQAA
ncbi:MAG TPA: dTDP-4-dehydrorhamnose reductase [Caulobacteraceae bacterium]